MQAAGQGLEGRASGPVGSLSYRQRESTQYRGVTKTSGTNSGIEKFDVQFVFCDQGTKKHPKIYGFVSATSAARAFDILTCKRALEKSRSMASVLGSTQALGTNHPASDYNNEALLTLLNTHSRDDIIYALKQCAKRGHGLEPSQLVAELSLGLEAARLEAHEKERMGDARQSYEPTAKPSSERKRKMSSAAAAAAAGPDTQRQAHLVSHRSSSSVQQLHQQQHERRQLHALMSAGQLPPYTQPPPLPPPQLQPPPAAQPSLDVPASLQQQLSTADMVGLAALAANLLGGGSGGARSAAAPAPEPEPSRVLGRLQSFSSRLALPPPQPSAGVSGLAAPAAAGGAGTPPLQQMLLLQLLQGQLGGGEQGPQGGGGMAAAPPSLIKSEPVMAATGASTEGVDFLLECLRLGMNTSPELSCAHDLVRIWVCITQGKAWADGQYNLPQWYYMGLVPFLQNCASVPALLAFCGHLWQLGALRVMLAALAGNLPQATVISLLQSVAAAAGTQPPGTAATPPHPAVPLPHADTSLQAQASVLVSTALQHVQRQQQAHLEQEQQAQQQQQQQAQVLKAAVALLGAVTPPPQPEAEPSNVLPQLLAGLLGGAAGSGGAPRAPAPPAPAATAPAEPQSQLTQLMQLLSGVVSTAGAAASPQSLAPAGAGAAATAARRGAAAEGVKLEPGAAQAASPDNGSGSTRTDSGSMAEGGQEMASRPAAQRQQRQGRGKAAAAEIGAGLVGDDKSMASVFTAATEGPKALPAPAPAAKRQRTTHRGMAAGLSAAAAEGSGQGQQQPEFDAVVAAAAEALGADIRAGPAAAEDGAAAAAQGGSKQQQKELSLEAAGPEAPSVQASPFFSDPRRGTASEPPGAKGQAGGGSSKEATAHMLNGKLSAPPLTRPHPFKAPLPCDPAAGGSSAPASKLDILTQAASIEAGALGKQHSAFSRFGQQAEQAGRPPLV